MNNRNGGVIATVAFAAIAGYCVGGPAWADEAARAPGAIPQPRPAISKLIESDALDVETVTFANPQQHQVRVVRGPKVAHAPEPSPAIPEPRREIVSFGTGLADQVIVVRGGTSSPPGLAQVIPSGMKTRVEKVAFSDPSKPAVNVIRGETSGDMFFTVDPSAAGLFDPASTGELDRVAFAVDGVELRHGADERMWRPEAEGPQGPMQVSAAAALDVGGGDRFDVRQNRLMGRAYLAQMFQRYGNWPDAIAAYNWGPGNMDQWIGGGRNTDRLPIGVLRYTNHVLRDALVVRAARL